jgi:DNA repair exonuclease SbcCD ATPase subunit
LRLLRLRVRAFRGINEREVTFAPVGVTIVQGPNEAGKSSLAEAIDLLLDEPDSSQKEKVRAVKPVDQDAGTEIELEAEAGAYALTYFKRFHRERETKLTIHRPRAEVLTGRAAHERMLAILGESVDLDLWRALRIVQGEGIQPLKLGQQTSLARALDRAAGEMPAGEREEDLFARVRAEYLLYHTPTGKDAKVLTEAAEAERTALEEVLGLDAERSRFEADVERAARLSREVAACEAQESELAPRAAAAERCLADLRTLRAESERLAASAEAAEAVRRECETVLATRRSALDEGAQRVQIEQALAAEVAAARPVLEEAERTFAQAEAEDRAAREALDLAESLERLRRSDVEFRRGEIELEQLRERKQRYDAAREAAALAEDLLAKTRVSDELIAKIKQAQLAWVESRARLDAGAPMVELHALTDLVPEIEGAPEPLAQGESRALRVSDSVRVVVPGALALTVTSGASAAKLAEALAEAETRLARLLSAAGVADLAQAEAANEARREALRRKRAFERAKLDELRDLTCERLEGKLAGLQRRVPAYPAERSGSAPPLPPDLDSAKDAHAEAERAFGAAKLRASAAESALRAARARREERTQKRRDAEVRLRVAEEARRQAEQAITNARSKTPDEKLAAALAEAAERARVRAAELAAAEVRLLAVDPERLELRAEANLAALAKLRAELDAARTASVALSGELAGRGEAGLQEKLDAARTRYERLARDGGALRRRAAAARLLHDTLQAARMRARQAYAEPLRRRIEDLGSLVFGSGFRVELDEELRVATRVLDGVPVPFDALSGGAREQISLVMRLASAMCAAEEGGVPVVLDDALGYTDPLRLEAMGIVLSLAARLCQIIVLTCVPDRYRYVAGARVVSLGEPRSV